MQSSGSGLGGLFGGSRVAFSSSPCFFFFFFLFLALRHCCGMDEALAGPKRRENLNTCPGRNSGNKSVTVFPSWVVSLPSLLGSSKSEVKEFEVKKLLMEPFAHLLPTVNLMTATMNILSRQTLPLCH